MLDYTSLFRAKLGVVAFTAASIRYVPTHSGIYQIIPIPFGYSELAKEGLGRRYMSALHGHVLDTSKRLETQISAGRKSINVKILEDVNMPEEVFSSCSSDLILESAILFPPFYIGQAENLRKRFTDHVQGRSSPIIERLNEAGLAEVQTFFRWTCCPPESLSALESVLIKSHQPVLNIQQR